MKGLLLLTDERPTSNPQDNLKIWFVIYETEVNAWPEKGCEAFMSPS